MKRLFIAVVLFVFIAGVCVVACPQKEMHVDALIKKINQVVDKELSADVVNEEDKALAFLASSFVSGLSELIIESKLSVDNYFLFSVGRITFDGESNVVSVGVLNHVFIDLSEEMKELLCN